MRPDETNPPLRFKGLRFGFTALCLAAFAISEALNYRVPIIIQGLFVVGWCLFTAVSWLPRQFSLRTLLITTTLVAVVLGASIYATR
jgi:hypothetical protein